MGRHRGSHLLRWGGGGGRGLLGLLVLPLHTVVPLIEVLGQLLLGLGRWDRACPRQSNGTRGGHDAVGVFWSAVGGAHGPIATYCPSLGPFASIGGGARDALEGKGPQRQPQRRLGRRLEVVAKAVGGGYCRLQMPLKLALGVRETISTSHTGAHQELFSGDPDPNPRLVLGKGGEGGGLRSPCPLVYQQWRPNVAPFTKCDFPPEGLFVRPGGRGCPSCFHFSRPKGECLPGARPARYF